VEGRPRYARSGDVSIAYRVLGGGGPDVVFVPGFTSNVADMERFPGSVIWHDLIETSRFIIFDKRGTGLSDRTDVGDLETRMDDVRAVMDAAGCESAHLVGVSEGGPLSILFAATHPDRVRSLSLVGSFARFTRSPSHPWQPTREEREEIRDLAVRFWGSGAVLETFLPEEARSDELREQLAACEMNSASPSALHRLFDVLMDIDVCDVLPSVRVPTLIAFHEGDVTVLPECGRYLADHIPGARLVTDDAGGHVVMAGSAIHEEVFEFITGSRPVVADERVLATVLFTDIVGSTERAAAEGDARWRALLDRHDTVTRNAVEEHRGVAVKSTGDGFLARFDGPGRAVACARAIGDRLRAEGLEVRAGLHTGEIELRGDDIGGLAVHVAARVAGLADAGEVFTTRTVKDLTVGSALTFEERGEHDLKGVPDRWAVYAVA
jgi:pimeloyl-ACP methyl ester carboxylesterase